MIRLKGVRTHNLKDVNLEIPVGALVCLTGPSGSGKSSLAFDTLCVEARRRYFEVLRLSQEDLPHLAAPLVREAEGLPPAIGLEQRLPRLTPRSTVGTLTGILDFLRVLYAELGEVVCPQCQRAFRPQSRREILEEIARLPQGSKLYVLAPLKEPRPEAFRYLMGEGFSRFLFDDQVIDLLEEELPSAFKTAHVLVDRLVLKSESLFRLEEALRLAAELAGGVVQIKVLPEKILSFTLAWRCPGCGWETEELRPELFSYNHPSGACPHCQGLGEREGKVCAACKGRRLRPEVLRVRFQGKDLASLAGCPLEELNAFLAGLSFSGFKGRVFSGLYREIKHRLKPLLELGLGHLNLFRSGPSLASGELQRVRLAALFGERLSGCLYVLDEPTLALSPREKDLVLALLRRLQAQGNTVVVVEHDPLLVRAADLVVELGPGAGEAGGEVLFSGPPEELAKRADLPTGAFFSGQEKLTRPRKEPQGELEIKGIRLPKGVFIVLCGPSGAGKTRFLREIAERLPEAQLVAPAEPRGRDSLVISYVGAFKALRELLAATKEARLLGLKPAHFSPFSREGRCPHCGGTGEKEIRLPLLSPWRVKCEECQGTGLKREALKVRYRGYHPGEILALTVSEAKALLARHPLLKERLQLLEDVGLGYLRLGQSLRSLSGGERQRLSLARFLTGKKAPFLLLDLPSLGLHLRDLHFLLRLFDRLLAEGKTLVVADNHPALVLLADYLLVFSAGEVVYAGSPEEWLAHDPAARPFEPYLSLVSRP